MPDKTYRVANPRELPEGTRILATTDKEWFEGDDIKPEDLEGFMTMVQQGYVVEVKPERKRAEKPEVTDAS